MKPRHIGLDLDNTLIDFDDAFPSVGRDLDILPQDRCFLSKDEVKSFLWSASNDREKWMRLQGQVYGRFIGRARLHRGAAEFLMAARKDGCRLSIVSHKTRLGHFDPHHVDLWKAALDWLEARDFFLPSGVGMSKADVYFSETRSGKLDLIGELGCEVFVDDLPEVLNDPRFPQRTVRMWFAAGKPAHEGRGLTAYRSWSELAEALDRLI